MSSSASSRRSTDGRGRRRGRGGGRATSMPPLAVQPLRAVPTQSVEINEVENEELNLLHMLDIRENDDTYFFRVSLPGLTKAAPFYPSFNIQPTGKVTIKGTVTSSQDFVEIYSMRFEMITKNLPPPGEQTITFNLPGPVDDQNCSGAFGNDGCFEGSARKKTI